jgi:hypothetical protein
MRYLQVVEAQVVQGKMHEFTAAVQQWQRAVLAHEDGPTHQSVLVDTNQPSRVLLLTEFRDEGHARRFTAAGLDESLLERIDRCCAVAGTGSAYLVYYESGQEGPEVIYGKTQPYD